MKTGLELIHEIRRRGRQAAARDLAAAHRECAESARSVEATEGRVARARGSVEPGNPLELALYHAFRLRMEMLRREQERDLEDARGAVVQHRERLGRAMRREQATASLIEHREERRRLDDLRREVAELDELAIQAWWRECA